jgi:hypothetical protein
MGGDGMLFLSVLGELADMFFGNQAVQQSQQQMDRAISGLNNLAADFGYEDIFQGLPLSYGGIPLANMPGTPGYTRPTIDLGGAPGRDPNAPFTPGPTGAFVDAQPYDPSGAGAFGGIDLAELSDLPQSDLSDLWGQVAGINPAEGDVTLGPATEPVPLPGLSINAGASPAAFQGDLNENVAGIEQYLRDKGVPDDQLRTLAGNIVSARSPYSLEQALGAAGIRSSELGDIPGVNYGTAGGLSDYRVDTSGIIDFAMDEVDRFRGQVLPDIQNIISEGVSNASQAFNRLEPGTLAGQVNWPEFNFEHQQRAALDPIHRAARDTTATATEGSAARALASGQTLQATQANRDAIARQVGLGAQGAGLQATSDIADRGLALGVEKAIQEGQFATTEAGINASIDQAIAGIRQAGASGSAQALQNIEALASGTGMQGLTSAAQIDAGNLHSLLQGNMGLIEAHLQNKGMDASQALAAAQGLVNAEQGDFEQALGAAGLKMSELVNLLINPSLAGMGLQAGLGSQIAGLTSAYPFYAPQPGQSIAEILMLNQALNPPSMNQKMGIGGGFATIEANFSTCVDGMALVPTPTGYKMLMTITPGDEVTGADNKRHVVLATDYGSVPEEARAERLWVLTDSGLSIKVTKDHGIGGKKAEEWDVGDTITMATGNEARIVSIQPCPYVHSGDLYLDGNADYVADGFTVQSNLGPMIEAMGGLEKWDEHVAAQEA